MRISVYLKEQDYLVTQAAHRTSRSVAYLVIAMGMARVVGQNAIQLSTEATWRELKNKMRGTDAQITESGEIWALLPPLDFYMPWTDLPLWLLKIYDSHKARLAA